MSGISGGCLSFGWMLVLAILGGIGLSVVPMPDESLRSVLRGIYGFGLLLWWIVSLVMCD